MFETFCLRLAAGLVLGLLILPARQVSPRFFRIHLLIALGLTVAAGVAAWETAPDWLWLPLGLASAASFAGYGCWQIEGAPGGYAALTANAAAFVGAFVALHASMQPDQFAFAFTQDATSAALLGTAMTAMLMGHWYLIAPTMSLVPLMRLLRAFFFALGVRAAVAVVTAAQVCPWVLTDYTSGVWLSLRWGAGLLGALVFGWMAWQSARIRSTQSATGILYVVVILVFVGELTDQLLQIYRNIRPEASFVLGMK